MIVSNVNIDQRILSYCLETQKSILHVETKKLLISLRTERKEMFKTVYRKSITMILFFLQHLFSREGRIRFVWKQIKRC